MGGKNSDIFMSDIRMRYCNPPIVYRPPNHRKKSHKGVSKSILAPHSKCLKIIIIIMITIIIIITRMSSSLVL